MDDISFLAKITDAPVKVAQDKSGEAVGTRYFDHGIPSHWIYILAFLLLIIVLLLLILIIPNHEGDRNTKNKRNSRLGSVYYFFLHDRIDSENNIIRMII